MINVFTPDIPTGYVGEASKLPQLILGGPDDANSRGVLIPTTSMAQYGATLAKWFGATDAELDQVFPVLANFSVRDLGFMY